MSFCLTDPKAPWPEGLRRLNGPSPPQPHCADPRHEVPIPMPMLPTGYYEWMCPACRAKSEFLVS